MTIAFTAPLWVWSGESGRWHFITVPEQVSGAIGAHGLGDRRGFGSVRVEVRAGDSVWRTSVFPQKSGGYLLPVKAEIRRRLGVDAGDPVTVELELL